MNMNFNLTPNFKAIRYFERMTNTSFLEVDKHTEFLPQLLYCCLLVHPENNFKMTFEEACEEFFPQYIDDLVKEFSNPKAKKLYKQAQKAQNILIGVKKSNPKEMKYSLIFNENPNGSTIFT